VLTGINYDFCNGLHLKLDGYGDASDRFDVNLYDTSNRLSSLYKSIGYNELLSVDKTYYIPWRIVISQGPSVLFDYTLSLQDKKVVIASSLGLGDTLAWIPYVDVFQKVHKCAVTFWSNYSDLLKSGYPNIQFTSDSHCDNVYAMYQLGCNDTIGGKLSPEIWYKQNLQDVAKTILGLTGYGELKPSIVLEDNLQDDLFKVVCIATEATFDCKQWNYPHGWEHLAFWLKQQGYTVVNLSVDSKKIAGIVSIGKNASLLDIALYIKHCKFFIGLSSGLSWLAWAFGKNMAVIYGATESWHEFKDKIAICPPEGVCHGCIHAGQIDRSKPDWCPMGKSFECTKSINPQQVIDAIKGYLVASKSTFLSTMNKPLWSFVLIAKNEAKTLPRFMGSIKEFTNRGGITVVVDTGSTDGTPEVARKLGCIVYEEGRRFMTTISADLANGINTRFIVGDDKAVVSSGQELFDYSAARNYAASKAPTDVIAMPDCDEAWTKLDIDAINKAIEDGIERFEYNFVFSHDQFGNEVVKFLHSKFYDRRKVHWEGIIHELLMGDSRTKFFDESVMKLEHWQNHETNRSGYLTGLALDCYLHPEKDRNSHYFAREMLFMGRYKSAIKEFERHMAMDKWLPEKAQSMIYVGDCYIALGEIQKGLNSYFQAYCMDGSRRESLLKLAHHYYRQNDAQRTAAFAAASLTVPWNNFYCNTMTDYTFEPHQLMYWSLWWLGDRKGSKEHWDKAFNCAKFNPKFIQDGVFYNDYKESGIDGWMNYKECVWLHGVANKMDSICEIGSWKGRSTHALLSGTKGTVTAVDHFKGSVGEDGPHAEAKQPDDPVYRQFIENTKGFDNLNVYRSSSLEAAAHFEGQKFDMVFIDAEHSYEAVKKDIKAWKSKAKLLICGHDYSDDWPGVKRAVHEEIGLVDHCESIWYKWLVNPKVSIVIPTLDRPEKLERLLNGIKDCAGYSNYEVIVKQDSFPPYNIGVPVLVKTAVAESSGDLVMYLGDDCVPKPDFLLNAVLDMARWFPNLDGLIALNDGYWKGEMATHWLASKKLLQYLGGEFFHTGYYHAGCDNELTERCRMLNKYAWSERALVDHDHPIKTGFKPEQMDATMQFAYQDVRRTHDQNLLEKRSKMFGFTVKDFHIEPVVPRQIYTIWLNDSLDYPDLIKKCIATHNWPGYRHRLITLDNCNKDSNYVKRCIELRQWARAADYLRAYYLWKTGGIYIDADMEVLKDFDDYLTSPLTCDREDNGFIANSFISANQGNRILKAYMDGLDGKEFDMSADSTWHNGMGAWTVLIQNELNGGAKDINVLDIGSLRGRLLHYYSRSWTQTPAVLK
jgi:autotransporter strand-loop-strand O-heptosyltransferase